MDEFINTDIKKEFSHILSIHTSGYQDNFWVRITPFGYKYRYMPTRVKNKGQNNRTNVISSCCIKLIYAISYSLFILPSFSPFLSHNSSRKKRINIVRKKAGHAFNISRRIIGIIASLHASTAWKYGKSMCIYTFWCITDINFQ